MQNHIAEIREALVDIGEVIPLKKQFIPEGLTILFEGPQRVGKTLGGVIWTVDAYQHGRNVFTNIQLGFPHDPLDFRDIRLEDGRSRYWNGHIFIDELNFFFDARRSLSAQNIEFGAFLLQQKKQGCNLTGTTHDVNYLDLRLRDNYDFKIRPRVFPRYPQRPKVIEMRIENGPTQPSLHRAIRIACEPFLALYDSAAVYDPFKHKRAEREDREPPTRGRRVTL